MSESGSESRGARDVFRAPHGTRDVLAPESDRWQELVARFADRARRFGYGLVLTPMFEHAEVFHRVGMGTDVVSKEMYEFTDRGGRRLALRPEGTASVVRAFVQNHPPIPWKCWYIAPNFRAERPQKGRYRQHYQVGAEVLGVDDPDVDVEVISLLWGFLRDLGLSRTRLLLNSMGDVESRARHRVVLLDYFHSHADLLGDEMTRAEANPLRILDSKRADWQPMLEAAPQLGHYLSAETAEHFERVQVGLRALAIPYEIAPRLVRGFDYYTRTTFELQSDTIDAAQNALGGGGRYDRLAEEMGGSPTPSIGFGAGVERILLACDAEAALPAPAARVEVFVVDLMGTSDATVLLDELRERGLSADRAYGGRSVKKQWSAADKAGAAYGVMLAPAEAAAGKVAVKDLRSGEQVEVERGDVATWLLATGVRASMMRTHRAGDLRIGDEGSEVTLCGWVAHRRDHGGVVFLDLRDVAGTVQVVVDPAAAGCEAAHQVRGEWVLQIRGTVRGRPEGTVNADMPTGAVELSAESVVVLSESEPVPFPLDDRTDIDEVLRLRHRYLDLRRAPMQRNLRIRAAVNAGIRTSMEAAGFVEVETPMLIASTPEGARDFVVPSRLQPGSFYALPQSPQLFKQLLMVGGFDRYYQIARCLRDEDLRADRQFEFMQLDAEMSFADQDDVLEVISAAVLAAAESVRGGSTPPIEKMTWLEAAERYGTDKPDLRFGMELADLSDTFAATEFRAFAGAEVVKGICVGGQGDLPRSRVDALVDRAKALGAAGLVWMRVAAGSALESPVVKFLSESEQLGIVDTLGAKPGDLVLIAAGERAKTRSILGQLRLDLGRPPVGEGPLRFVWIVDFPLFEALGDDGRPIPADHAFTMPHPDDIDRLESDPLSVRSQSYDLVINGWELGSGSVRIHRADIQNRVFALLGIDAEQAQERFGFLLDAFKYGAPPHAGFAFGIDRFVAVLAGEENIREVIAFPKTQSGSDPLTDAPTPIDAIQLRDLGLQLRKPPS